MSPKNFRNISHPEQKISIYWPNFSKYVSQLKDWQTYKKFVGIWKKCTNISGMSPKSFRNISHAEQEISPYMSNFSKEVSQLMDSQTYNKYATIWKKCTNISGISPKKFRKISHSEQEISLYLSNFNKKVSQLTYWQTHKNLLIIRN